MNKNNHPSTDHHSRSVFDPARWGRRWLVACLMIGMLLLGRVLWRPAAAVTQLASATPTTSVDWRPSATGRDDQGSLTTVPRCQPIETLRVGDRVVADNPDTDTPAQTAVDPATWRKVILYAEQTWPDGTLDTIHVETLQPPLWLELFDVAVGAEVPPPLDLVEMGLPEELVTTVTAVEPCPQLKPGNGRVVLTTVNHLNNDVWQLTAIDSAGHQEHLRPTGFHRFYSETRGDWVSTKEIHDNEVIRGRAGPLRIVAKRQLPGVERVYNLTVEGEHVYYVSELGLLAHNTCRVQPRDARGRFLSSEGDSFATPGTPFQNRVLEALGVKRANGFGVSEISSRVTTRPDLLIGNRFGVTEIKDEIAISLTAQLRSQFAAAKTGNLPFNLIISPRTTTIYGPVRRAVEATGGIITQFDSVTGKFTTINNFNGSQIIR